MKYNLFFGETEKQILAAETPKKVMQVAWRAGVILPKKVAVELFREAEKYRRHADLEKMEDHALEAVTGGVDAFQTVLCRYGLHRPGQQVNKCSFICACCGKLFAPVIRETEPPMTEKAGKA